MKKKKSSKKNELSSKARDFKLTVALFPFLCLLLIGLIKGTALGQPGGGEFWSSASNKSSILAFTVILLAVIDIVCFVLLYLYSAKESDNPAIPQFYIFYFIGICLQLFLLIGMSRLSIVTYHQKVFKTFLLFVFNLILLGLFIINYMKNKENIEKKRGYLFFFLAYFIYILIQYIVALFSKEVTYDSSYYLANYSLLIIFSLFFYLYLKDLHDIKILLLLFQFFIIVVFVWSIADLIGMIRAAAVKNQTLTFFNIIMNLRPKLSFGNTNYFAGYLIGFLPLIFIAPYLLTTNENSSLEVSIMLKQKGIRKVLGIISLIFVAPLVFLAPYLYKKSDNDDPDSSVMIKNREIIKVISILSFIIVIPLFLTQTTASFFGFYVGFVFFALSLIGLFGGAKKSLYLVWAAVILILIPFLLAFFAPDIVKPIMPRLAYKLSNLGFSIYDRMNGWTGGLQLFSEYPIFGAGLGSVYAASFKYSNKYYYIYSDSNSFKHSHNEYIEILGEAGIVGITLFTLLIGFVLFSLIRNAFFNKSVSNHYRIIAVAVAAGIISMLVQQFFSLTLRMSVTMTAFFSLLGIGIFLLFYAGKNKTAEGALPPVKRVFAAFLAQREFYLLFLVIAIGIVGSFSLFLPLFRSENMIIRSFLSKSSEMRGHYLNRAVKIMPGNPYAWTEKFRYDFDYLQALIREYQGKSSDDEYSQTVEKQFSMLKEDLDTLDAIIPGYQNMAAKYTQFNMVRSQYYYKAYNQTRDMDFYYKYLDNLQLVFTSLDSSINENYLNLDTHINKMIFLSLAKKEGVVFTSALSDYIRAQMLRTYCRHRQNIKENVSINMSAEKNLLEVDGDKRVISIGTSYIRELEKVIYGQSNYEAIRKTLNARMTELIKELDESS